MKIINISIFVLILFTLISCNSPTETPIDNTPPGKRDYIWSIDSVDYGNRPSTIQLESIWGSSSTKEHQLLRLQETKLCIQFGVQGKTMSGLLEEK